MRMWLASRIACCVAMLVGFVVDVSMCMLLLFMRMLMFVLVPRSALPGVHSVGAIYSHRTLPTDPRSKRGTPVVLSVRAL